MRGIKPKLPSSPSSVLAEKDDDTLSVCSAGSTLVTQSSDASSEAGTYAEGPGLVASVTGMVAKDLYLVSVTYWMRLSEAEKLLAPRQIDERRRDGRMKSICSTQRHLTEVEALHSKLTRLMGSSVPRFPPKSSTNAAKLTLYLNQVLRISRPPPADLLTFLGVDNYEAAMGSPGMLTTAKLEALTSLEPHTSPSLDPATGLVQRQTDLKTQTRVVEKKRADLFPAGRSAIRLVTAASDAPRKSTAVSCRELFASSSSSSSSVRHAGSSEPLSPVRVSVLVFAIASVIEAGAIVLGAPLPSAPFALLFFVNLWIRVLHKEHRDAILLLPVDYTLLGLALFDRWVYRTRGVNPIKKYAKTVIKRAKGSALKKAMRHPVRTMGRVRKALRLLRWITWALPLLQVLNSAKQDLTRFIILQRQNKERMKRQRALSQIRDALDHHTSCEEAAKRIQASYRGRKARRHLLIQRRAAQLRARAAAGVLLRAVQRHRKRLQEAADMRPLLLRPNSGFVVRWKLGILFLAFIDVARVMLAAEGTGQLTHEELFSSVFSTGDCVPRMVPLGRRKFLGLLGPRALISAPLPEHCSLGLNLMAAAAIQLLAALMSTIVGVVATMDVLIEFFTGSISPVTGILEPKPVAERYFLPPFSLLFNIAVNPALSSANTALHALLRCGNPYVLFRLVVNLQPICQHFEAWLAPRARRLIRRNTLHLSGKTHGEGGGRQYADPPQRLAAWSAEQRLAARSAARLFDEVSTKRRLRVGSDMGSD